MNQNHYKLTRMANINPLMLMCIPKILTALYNTPVLHKTLAVANFGGLVLKMYLADKTLVE